MDRKNTKVVHQLDTPFSAVQWPQISLETQESVLELLCSLLSPLGHHRRDYITRSKGKRRKKHMESGDTVPRQVPPVPEVAAFVDIGLASISRGLERASGGKADPDVRDRNEADKAPLGRPYAAVFVARSSQPPAFSSHFPQMVAAASKAQPGREPIRLVGLSKACEDRLSECLGIPRASSVALHDDAPQSKPLVDFVRARVPPIEVPWLQEAQEGRHRDTNIVSSETAVGVKRRKKG